VLLNLSGRGDKDVAQMMDIPRVSADVSTTIGPLETALRAKRADGRKLLVPYVTGGLGDDWLDVVRAVADAGADAIEIGIPFSDPVMDGPGHPAGLGAGAGRRGRPAGHPRPSCRGADIGVPLAVMTYYNICFHMGHERFADFPAPGRGWRRRSCRTCRSRRVGPWAGGGRTDIGVETVSLAAPTAPDERLPRVV